MSALDLEFPELDFDDILPDTTWIFDSKSAASKRREQFPTEARTALNTWLLMHSENPYMNTHEKEWFSITYGLTKKQITTFLTNQRIRLLGRRSKDSRRHMPLFAPIRRI